MTHLAPERQMSVDEMKSELDSKVHADCTPITCNMMWHCVTKLSELGRAVWVLHWADKRTKPIPLPGGLI